MDNLITIVGPTAVGKTELTLQLATILKTEVISGDAYQVYRDLNIGTAKPSPEELQVANHYLIDILEPDSTYSVADFKIEAEKLIKEINSKGCIPILSGGTGLYVQALLENYHLSDTSQNEELRMFLDHLYETEGLIGIRNYGQSLAQKKGITLRFEDKHRLYRAIELLEANDIESLVNQSKDGLAYNGPVIGLTRAREELYERINLRVDLMIKQGLIEEVEELLASGVSTDSQAFKGIGYKEVISYLQGSYDKVRCIELIKQNTRHFAKRQLTWYKRMPYIHWIQISEKKDTGILREAKKIIYDSLGKW